jgi:two-component sensor histidine kinase
LRHELGRLATESETLVAFDWNAITGALSFNKAGCQRFGVAPDSSIALSAFLTRVERADVGRLEENLNRILSGDSEKIDPFRVHDVNGDMVTLNGHGSVVVDSAGHRHVVGLQYDKAMRVRRRAADIMSAEEKAHQIKNILGVISGMAAMSQRTSASTGEFVSSFNSRLQILARCADLVATSQTGYLPITVFVSSITSASAGSGRVSVKSCGFGIDLDSCQMLAIAVHELSVNALRHGALNVVDGSVSVEFVPQDDGSLQFHWREVSSSFMEPDKVHKGFGWQVLTRAIAREFDTQPEISWNADGLSYRLSIPRERLLRFGDGNAN